MEKHSQGPKQVEEESKTKGNTRGPMQAHKRAESRKKCGISNNHTARRKERQVRCLHTQERWRHCRKQRQRKDETCC